MKKLPVLWVFCMFLSVVIGVNLGAQDNQGLDPRGPVFQLDTDMLRFCSPTTALFLGWQHDANALFQLGLDRSLDFLDLRRPGNELSRFGLLTVFTGAGFVVNQAFSLTAHDESHMDTARAVGGTNVGLVRVDTAEPMTIGEFFLEAFNVTAEPGGYTWTPPDKSPLTTARVAAAGLNTNMLIAERIGQTMDEGEGHVTDLAPYLLNKLWGINYFLQTGPNSDGANYIALLNGLGYNTVTANNVILLHAVSFATSGGFLGLVRGTWNFVAGGQTAVAPLGLPVGDFTVYWPELTPWLNPDNVSQSIAVDAAWQDTVRLRAAVDTPILGNTRSNTEITCGVKGRIHRLGLGIELTSGFTGFPFLLADTEVVLNDTVSVGLEGHYGNGFTMRERREYPLGPGAAGVLKVRI